MDASKILLNMIDIDEKNVYAIGDDDNDYELLVNYKSGTFEWASEKIKNENVELYDSALEFMNCMEVRKNEK